MLLLATVIEVSTITMLVAHRDHGTALCTSINTQAITAVKLESYGPGIANAVLKAAGRTATATSSNTNSSGSMNTGPHYQSCMLMASDPRLLCLCNNSSSNNSSSSSSVGKRAVIILDLWQQVCTSNT
jgi:hypothetical protein